MVYRFSFLVYFSQTRLDAAYRLQTVVNYTLRLYALKIDLCDLEDRNVKIYKAKILRIPRKITCVLSYFFQSHSYHSSVCALVHWHWMLTKNTTRVTIRTTALTRARTVRVIYYVLDTKQVIRFAKLYERI